MNAARWGCSREVGPTRVGLFKQSNAWEKMVDEKNEVTDTNLWFPADLDRQGECP